MALTVYLKKVKMSSFFKKNFMHNMPTTEVVGVDLRFLKHFVFSETFPFPKELLYSCCFQVKWL